MSNPIDGKTQLVGLIGWPVEHSLSPLMHNAAFEVLGLNWRYIALPVRPGYVRDAIRGIAALGLRGANVTVPHKQDVFREIDIQAPSARVLGAANTLVINRNEEGAPTIIGHNTDVEGFIRALGQRGVQLTDARCVVVGAGGAARAVIFGLLAEGVRMITVLNRTVSRAKTLLADLALELTGERTDPPQLEAIGLTPDTLLATARRADLLVNATTVGMWPNESESIWPWDVPVPDQLTVFDLVYNPLETRLLTQARESGARPIDGLGMLVSQGAAAFELWTGFAAPVDLMRATCEGKLASG